MFQFLGIIPYNQFIHDLKYKNLGACMSTLPLDKLIVEGTTQDGTSFRPSDWAERVSGNLSTFKNQRIHYSPLLYPCRSKGVTCLVVDMSLQESNRELFQQIIDFAKTNKLGLRYPTNNTPPS
jgi:hypothetical protein